MYHKTNGKRLVSKTISVRPASFNAQAVRPNDPDGLLRLPEYPPPRISKERIDFDVVRAAEARRKYYTPTHNGKYIFDSKVPLPEDFPTVPEAIDWFLLNNKGRL